MTTGLTPEEARRRVILALESLKSHIGGEWPLVEAFTDLDDHPEEDENGGFNHEVGYVRGLCEAFGFDETALAREVDPTPPKDSDWTPEFCEACDKRPSDFTGEHTPDCSGKGTLMCRLHHVCDEDLVDPDEEDEEAGEDEVG